MINEDLVTSVTAQYIMGEVDMIYGIDIDAMIYRKPWMINMIMQNPDILICDWIIWQPGCHL